MQDLLLITPLTADEEWSLDIDIVSGRAKEVPGDSKLQRVAIASYLSKGSIPGMEAVGVDWAGFLAHKTSLIECDNQVKTNMEAFASASQIPEYPYPMYKREGEGINISLISLKTPEAPGA